MKALLELHILQNFAPSNLNRDDTGSPKDAIFGGVRRARISSQSLKRAMRLYFQESKLLEKHNLAERSKRLVEELKTRLVARGKPDENAELAAIAAITAMGSQKQFKVTKSKAGEQLTDYLVFLGESEIERLAQIIFENWDALTATKVTVSKELKVELEKSLDGGKAVDVALFGRMLANLPEKNQDAACQVAHALSTNKVEREFDFYTAVDDLKPDDNAGADMLGTVEFNSACYYRYACLDLEKLKQNLQGDSELLERGLQAFLRAAIFAAPSGKQNSFAAHNPPSFIAFTVRRDASPRNLANAFEKPARPNADKTLTQDSLEKLAAEWTRLEGVFGQAGEAAFVNITGANANSIGEDAGSVDALVSRTLERVKHTLGA